MAGLNMELNVVKFMALSGNSSGRTGEIHEEIDSGPSASQRRLPEMPVRSAVKLALFFSGLT